MKKLIATIIAVLSFAAAVCLSGCKFDFKSEYQTIQEESIKDGCFQYYYVEKVDRYAIVGDGDEPCPETVVIPAYYNDKEAGPYYTISGFYPYTIGPTLKGTKTVYYPYTCNLLFSNDMRFNTSETKPTKVFYPNNDTYSYLYGKIMYVSPLGLRKIIDHYDEGYDDYVINGYLRILNTYTRYQIANTSFMFNYNDEPNGGYFFINDFERGGLIEDTPYEPMREGYTFGGWYKESACISKWDFETDKLPDAEYDENGYVTNFIETRLYAKWIKNKAEPL